MEAGPADGPLMMFIHGWPELGLIWRPQIEFFSARGWRCVAPDMRGYGASLVPAAPSAYALRELVQDVIELHDVLGSKPAVWVGHDWGSPVVGALAAKYPERCRSAVLISLPYFSDGFALSTVVPLVDRTLYPVDQYPYGQWDYYRFYQESFDQAAADYEADIGSTIASVFRPGSASLTGKISPTAKIRAQGGRFGAPRRAPRTEPDPSMLSGNDFDAFVEAFRRTGFRGADAWYLNDSDNVAFCRETTSTLRQPVLYINGEWDPICDITRSRLGDPMRAACLNLSIVSLQGGHWLMREHPIAVNTAIESWLDRGGEGTR
jgi:pimeloyl-ACP methyl ester carboxylesterase